VYLCKDVAGLTVVSALARQISPVATWLEYPTAMLNVLPSPSRP